MISIYAVMANPGIVKTMLPEDAARLVPQTMWIENFDLAILEELVYRALGCKRAATLDQMIQDIIANVCYTRPDEDGYREVWKPHSDDQVREAFGRAFRRFALDGGR